MQELQASPKSEQKVLQEAELIWAVKDPEAILPFDISPQCADCSQHHNQQDTGNFLQVHFYLK